MTIEETIRIAVNAHDGQKDMVGNPAILHVLSVGLMGRNELEKKAGILHDVVEDTDLSIENLRSKGVEEGVLEAVDTGSRERRELLEEILRIAEIHDRAERYIRNSILRTSLCQDGNRTGRPAAW